MDLKAELDNSYLITQSYHLSLIFKQLDVNWPQDMAVRKFTENKSTWNLEAKYIWSNLKTGLKEIHKVVLLPDVISMFNMLDHLNLLLLGLCPIRSFTGALIWLSGPCEGWSFGCFETNWINLKWFFPGMTFLETDVRIRREGTKSTDR